MRRIAQSSRLAFDLHCYIPEKMFTFVLQNYLLLSRATHGLITGKSSG
ncbi:hypothetical protein F385_4293 [Pantoea agglomerans 299R]|nr:hypothetical protein F385_4293 [Pantoea agglomerans 299R]